MPTTVRGYREFWERLHELGRTEGQNLAIEVRWASGKIDRLPGLMTETTERKVDVLVTYSTPGALAAVATGSVVLIASNWWGATAGQAVLS